MRALAYGAALAAAAPAGALTLEACERTTHISHGGEDMHRDLGGGRVMWRNWWSQEGTFSDYVIADCAPGRALILRTAEERMNDRLPFDKTRRALTLIDKHEAGARVFATLERMAGSLEDTARDVRIQDLEAEPCACAAAYPDARGTKTPYAHG